MNYEEGRGSMKYNSKHVCYNEVAQKSRANLNECLELHAYQNEFLEWNFLAALLTLRI